MSSIQMCIASEVENHRIYIYIYVSSVCRDSNRSPLSEISNTSEANPITPSPNATLKELCLNFSGLHPEHMQLLGKALSNNHALSVLDISGNNIGPDGCQHLADVRNTSLSVLIMYRNYIGFEGTDYISRMLHINPSDLLTLVITILKMMV